MVTINVPVSSTPNIPEGETDEALLIRLCLRLRALRINRNISQEDLEKRSGVAVRTIKRLESGKAGNANLLTIIAIARGLGVSDQINTLFPVVKSPIAARNSHKGSQRARITGHHRVTNGKRSSTASDSNVAGVRTGSSDKHKISWNWGDSKK